MIVTWRVFIFTTLMSLAVSPTLAMAEECLPIEERPIKVEVWLSKKLEKDFRWIREDFSQMGHTWTALWTYPGENPSRIVAVGRCVPAYIARHILAMGKRYLGETNSLVHQNFIGDYWIGYGTSLFSENSQRSVSREKVERLIDPSLSSAEFQALYREFTVQEETVRGFGMVLPNPKLMK